VSTPLVLNPGLNVESIALTGVYKNLKRRTIAARDASPSAVAGSSVAWRHFARQQDVGLQYRCAYEGNVMARCRHSACRGQAARADDKQLRMGESARSG